MLSLVILACSDFTLRPGGGDDDDDVPVDPQIGVPTVSLTTPAAFDPMRGPLPIAVQTEPDIEVTLEILAGGTVVHTEVARSDASGAVDDVPRTRPRRRAGGVGERSGRRRSLRVAADWYDTFARGCCSANGLYGRGKSLADAPYPNNGFRARNSWSEADDSTKRIEWSGGHDRNSRERFVTLPTMDSVQRFLDHLADPTPQFLARSIRGQSEVFDVEHHREPPATARSLDLLRSLVTADREVFEALWTAADGIQLYWDASMPCERFPSVPELLSGEFVDHSFLRFEKIAEWTLLRTRIRESVERLGIDYHHPDAIPFAWIGGTSGYFVYDRGPIFYFSPLITALHDHRVAPDLGSFLDWIVADPARVLSDESVARFGRHGTQYTPVRYLSGR